MSKIGHFTPNFGESFIFSSEFDDLTFPPKISCSIFGETSNELQGTLIEGVFHQLLIDATAAAQ